MTVPKLNFTDTGVQIPDEPDVLEGVLSEMDVAFGVGLNKSLSTPQGQLAQSLTAIIGDKNAQILEISNQLDPERASGRWQDALGKIYFMERAEGAGTVVIATVSGLAGTVIPAGSLAQDTGGYIYESLSAVTIGSDGTAQVQFQNREHGAIACPAGALNRIYIAVTGWERITNDAAGVLGNDEETRYDFEMRRKNSVAIASNSMIDSVRAAVWACGGVTDVYVAENDTNAPMAVGSTNYTIPAHCLYVAVVGGTASDIATAIQSRKSAGCNTVGNTSYTIEMREGYSAPYPKYTYRWQTPSSVPLYFDVQIVADAGLPSDIERLVKAAIINAFNGKDGKGAATIGSGVYVGRYYAAVQACADNVQITSISLGRNSSAGQAVVVMGIDEIPVLSEANITVQVV